MSGCDRNPGELIKLEGIGGTTLEAGSLGLGRKQTVTLQTFHRLDRTRRQEGAAGCVTSVCSSCHGQLPKSVLYESLATETGRSVLRVGNTALPSDRSGSMTRPESDQQGSLGANEER